MTDFVEALMAEIASLEAEMARDVRYQRLRELQKLAELYSAAGLERTSPNKKASNISGKGSKQTTRRSSSHREKALLSAKDFVNSLNGQIVPTRQILQHLEENGIEVGGSSPLNNLSAIISTSGLFQAHGRSGWTLKGISEILHEQSRESS